MMHGDKTSFNRSINETADGEGRHGLPFVYKIFEECERFAFITTQLHKFAHLI